MSHIYVGAICNIYVVLVRVALVCLFVVYRETSGTNGTCVCYDNDGGVYNLQPLQRTDGDPRFESR